MRPLAGIRVLELGALIAGPFCAKILAEFGADVVKLEPPKIGVFDLGLESGRIVEQLPGA